MPPFCNCKGETNVETLLYRPFLNHKHEITENSLVSVRSNFFEVWFYALVYKGDGVGDVEKVDFEDRAEGRTHPVVSEFGARLDKNFL